MKIVNKKSIFILILLVICLGGFVLNGTYAKFTSSYTTNDTIADLSYNFDISISNIEEFEMASVSSGDFLIINVDVSNNLTSTIYYGVWYNIVEGDTLDDITIAQVESSANDTSGSISSGSTKTVTIIIKNNTDDNIKVKIGVSSSGDSVDSIKYNGDNKLITEISSQPILLSTVEVGSYVRYVGDNGCSGASCMGQNANYVSDDNMGYCHGNGTATYSSNGFRIAYTDNNNAYLINGGSTDCICTNSDGSMSNSSCSSSVTAADISLHQNNLNNSALKYCNTKFVEGNTCDNTTSWSMNTNDFENITGNALTSSSCYRIENSVECGYENDLIDNGNYYWFTTALDTDNSQTFSWNEYLRNTNSLTSDILVGMRPVIKLKANTYAIDGTGTYDDPYILTNDDIVTLSSGTTITNKEGSTNGITNSTINHNRTQEYLYLDGVDDYVNLGLENQEFPDGATIIARVRIKNAPNTDSYPEYSILRNSEGGGTGLYVTTNKFAYQIYNQSLSGYYIAYSTTFSLNDWYTIVGTYDNNELRIYVNGALEKTEASVGKIKAVSIPFAIGVNPGPSEEYFNGNGNFDVSDTFIYDRALTLEEVSTYFSDEVGDYPTDSLLSYFHFDAESVGS